MSVTNESINVIPKQFQGIWEGDSKIVIGVDIGTAHSRVSFAFLQTGVERAVHCVTCWPGQEAQSQQNEVPTLVWYDINGKAVSFGAEALLLQVEDNAEDNGWRLAKRFKLHLHPANLAAKLGLGFDPLPAGVSLRQIYLDFLGYLLKHTRSFFEDRMVDGRQLWEKHCSDMEVVITHPNGWGIHQQAFLRYVVIEAGFASGPSLHKIQFVTEAEAVFHFSIHHTDVGTRLQVGTRFAICDAGGSTVDTVVYSVVAASPSLKIEEAQASACIQAGTVFVDAMAEKYIRGALNGASLDAEDVEEYTSRGVKDFSTALRPTFCDATQDGMIEIAGPRFHNSSIRTRRGRMTLPGAIIKSFFDVCLTEIMASVDQQIRGLSVSFIILIGEFGESPYLRKEFRARYEPQGCQVILTNEATSKAVAEGAVIWSVVNNTSSQEEPPVLCRRFQRSRSEYDSLLSQFQPQEDYFDELRSLDAAMKEKGSKLQELDQAYERLTQELLELRQQVERTQSEHASLRSRLQLQENGGLSSVDKTLADLNWGIDGVARITSEYLIDKHVQKAFDKSPSDVTALDAHFLPELKALLGHVDGRSSLVTSWDHKAAIPLSDFLDYAIRSLLCKHICERIFAPFHPAVNSSQNNALAAMYHDIQQQETQTVAAKWRANCFKGIYKPGIPDAAAYHVGVIAREFVNGCLSPLLICFFGEKAGIELENQHSDRLTQLFRVAWDWNLTLKGEVIVEGDFQPGYYDPLHCFDPSLMSEIKPNPHNPQPEYILGTLNLGLLSSRAVGGGQGPEIAVVHKAIVATKGLYV